MTPRAPAPNAEAGRARASEAALRAVVEPLAALKRGAGSEGERRAAEQLRDMLEEAGARAWIDEEEFRPGYARMLLGLAVLGIVANRLVARGRRLSGGLLAALATGLIVDDVENGRRWWRRLVTRPETTWNVVGECGDADAERTLVVLAHHDAAPTGAAFDQSAQRWLARRFPDVVAGRDTALPIWAPVVAGPVATVLAALLGSRALARLGGAFSLVAGALGADIARERIVPGANDNLSGCAALVALTGRLRAEPVSGVRVLLASCGAEEVLQGGIHGFVDRHLRALDPGRTWVLNLDSIGSPELILVEGEGPFLMHDYCDPSFRDRVAAVAERATGAPLRRGARARASTDSIIASRAGYPSALLCSWEPDTKLVSNYHLFSDTPENLCWDTVGRAVDVVEAVAAELAEKR